jgi:integrase
LVSILGDAKQPGDLRDQALFELMLKTGIRIGSAIALDIEDIDLDGGRIHLQAVKGGGEQVVFMPSAISTMLRELMGDRASGPVFLARGQGRVSTRQAQRRFAQWLEKAGVRGSFSPHSLRHSFALGLYQRTGDVLLVKEALGHRSITSTVVYARADQDRLREAIGA